MRAVAGAMKVVKRGGGGGRRWIATNLLNLFKVPSIRTSSPVQSPALMADAARGRQAFRGSNYQMKSAGRGTARDDNVKSCLVEDNRINGESLGIVKGRCETDE